MVKENPKILVADDELKNIKLLQVLLLTKGYEVFTAPDGKKALEIISSQKIDLVLLDVMMPDMNGYEVCKAMKADEKNKFIPVIMVTALQEESEKIMSMEVGADYFLPKPVNSLELFARVRLCLRIKELQDELMEKYDKLKELDKIKNSLTYMIIHDLNNPLATISGELQLLKVGLDGKITEEEKKDLGRAFVGLRDLQMMIGNLLDVNKMEEGKINLIRENFRLTDLAKQVIDQMEVTAFKENKVLSLEISENIPLVSADKEIIKRVLANLVYNSLKFTPSKGSVILRITYKPEDKFVNIQVKDTGRGIPEEYLEKIFDKFVQVEKQNVRTGRGLGLTFCKMMVEAHGGKIRAESEGLDKGATFTIVLPA